MLTPDEADRALAELGAESDRLAEALVAMDGHPAHRLLGGDLTGVTRQRWDEAKQAMSALWEQFPRHRGLVERAREVRARRARPGQAELAELTELLTGEVVELTTLMEAGHKTVAAVLAEVEQAWQALAEQLGPLETLAEQLGAEARLAELRRRALADPLAQLPQRELARVRAEFDELVAVRDGFSDRQHELESLVDRVAAAEAEARIVSATVRKKIAEPGLSDTAARAPALRARLTELVDLWHAGQWKALSDALTALRRDGETALTEVRQRLAFATGLLERRLELRGRLAAYRAKAANLGHAEDLELGELHRTAHDLLHAAPSDLRAATVAVRDYQRAVRAREEGPE
ncbi:hypothetical protein FHX82_003742 [Amycolatopsis bartoniae]|uniref:Uncharacterized protein n=1 Tax=Amycolatopsis bartoniae TaxID=941986 RepID=A0A8H9M6P3_9PSEU|nr:hypothetical protein [Amycolatopsis bartoniae]MBB2936678.1 hypothetical protein [Amycolatopsis bartoniae]TVT09744.1 hypothetical protein FNH07_07330 [Amycolatopsis bartoniae]GHF67168.1 hypothetical protein GCM10017566_46100 [Amycolatopsis bartoniae]